MVEPAYASLSIRFIQNPRLTNDIVETGILALESFIPPHLQAILPGRPNLIQSMKELASGFNSSGCWVQSD